MPLLVALALLPLASASPSFVAVSPAASVTAKGDAQARAVSVSVSGRATIGGVAVELFPVEQDVKRRASKFAVHALTDGGGDVLVFADTELSITENGETGWLLDSMMAARVDKAGKAVWRQRLSNHSGDPTRHLFVTDKLIVLRERDGVEGVDIATGKKLWAVDRDSLESVLNDPQFWRASLDEKRGVLHVGGRFPLSTSDGRRAFEMELDVASGRRVFVKTSYAKPNAEPIYVRPPFRLEYPGDKAPPEVPTQWDGLRIRRSYLAWSKTTGEGIVVGPLATDANAIVDAAKAARVKAAPVKWLYVIDLPSIGRAAGAGLKPAPVSNAIVLESDGAVERAGERIDAGSVAKALGATVLDGANALAAPAPKASALAIFRPDENDADEVGLRWGPYVFVDEHPRNYRLEEMPW